MLVTRVVVCFCVVHFGVYVMNINDWNLNGGTRFVEISFYYYVYYFLV